MSTTSQQIMKLKQMNLPIDIIIYILSFLKHPPLKQRIMRIGNRFIFMNQIRETDRRYTLLRNITKMETSIKNINNIMTLNTIKVILYFGNSSRAYSIRVKYFQNVRTREYQFMKKEVMQYKYCWENIYTEKL